MFRKNDSFDLPTEGALIRRLPEAEAQLFRTAPCKRKQPPKSWGYVDESDSAADEPKGSNAPKPGSLEHVEPGSVAALG